MEGGDVFEEPNYLTNPAFAIHWFWYRTNAASDTLNLFRNWLSLIQNFTKRDFTTKSNALPALAGLATDFQAELRRTPGTDVSLSNGLWHGDLEQGLLWYCVSMAPEGPDSFERLPWVRRADLPHMIHGPSWAWASFECPVRFCSLNLFPSSFPVTLSFAQIKPHESIPGGHTLAKIRKNEVLSIVGKLQPLEFHYEMGPGRDSLCVRALYENLEFSLNWLQDDFDAAVAGDLRVFALAYTSPS